MGDPSEPVRTYLADVTPDKRRREAERLLELLARVTGEPPQLWGSIIGFGQYHYKYPSGREGDVAAAGFAPRKAATTIYLVDGVGRYEKQLERLGPHTTGVGCLYIEDLDKIDRSVLEAIVAESYRTVTAGTYMLRAREGTRHRQLTEPEPADRLFAKVVTSDAKSMESVSHVTTFGYGEPAVSGRARS